MYLLNNMIVIYKEMVDAGLNIFTGLYHCIDRYSILRATRDPDMPGLGFRYYPDDHLSILNPKLVPRSIRLSLS